MSCQFILNDDPRSPEYCGEPVWHETSWCDEHYRLCHTSARAKEHEFRFAAVQGGRHRDGGAGFKDDAIEVSSEGRAP